MIYLDVALEVILSSNGTNRIHECLSLLTLHWLALMLIDLGGRPHLLKYSKESETYQRRVCMRVEVYLTSLTIELLQA